MKLWARKVHGDTESLSWIAMQAESLKPFWFLHGCVLLPSGELEEGVTVAVYGEGDVYENAELYPGATFDDTPFTPEEEAIVMQAAAIQAVSLAVCAENLDLFGDVLLRKHPEFRNVDTDEEAYMFAALQERDDYLPKTHGEVS